MIKYGLRLAIILCAFGLPHIPNRVFADDLYSFTDENGIRYYTNRSRSGCAKVRFPLLKESFRSVGKVASDDYKMQNYEAFIVQAGKTHFVDPDLVRAVIKIESNFNPRAVSPKGAQGLMQLMPQTAKDLGVADPFNPAMNIQGGTMYLSRLLNTLEGNLPLCLAAYNAGPERVIPAKKIPAIRETRDYVRRVINYYSKLKGY